MELENEGVNFMSAEEIEKLFADIDDQTPPTGDDSTTSGTSTEPKKEGPEPTEEKGDVDKTKAFAKRLAESTAKARNEEREAIAREMGFESYEAMRKSKENKILTDKGLDPDEVSPIVEELVKQRLNDDPRMKELAKFREREIEEFGKRELAEITKLTDGEITQLSQLPKEVVELWKKKGSLKSAYIELEGEKLISRIRSNQTKGSTSHLQSPADASGLPSTKRFLTDEEKRVWKIFNPQTTDEELAKKTVDK